MYCLIFASLLGVLSHYSEAEGVRRVQSHLLLDDRASALEEAQALVNQYPESELVRSSWIEALAASGMEQAALNEWHRLSLQNPQIFSQRRLLEELSWGVLKKGLDSTQNGVRFAALIGAYLTHDVRAVPILVRMMRDSNAVIRSVAVQMAASYQDAPLKSEIVRLFNEEKVWIVRLEVLKAIGALRIKELSSQLEKVIASEKTTVEERHMAIEALLNIYEKLSPAQLEILARSDRAGIRHLACSIAAHFEMKESRDAIFKLMGDPHPNVKIAAINAFGLFYRKEIPALEAKERLAPLLEDPNAVVAITAAWAALLVDTEFGASRLARWLTDSLPENRRLAAAALSAAGKKGASLALKTLQESSDPYVKANAALGLLGQRMSVAASCDALYAFLENETKMWMWDTQPNPLFQVLAPSQVRHVDHIPNLKSFLQKSSWGITGAAAALLLQEGGDGALEIVRELLSDPDSNVRLQACLVLAMLGRDESVLADLQGAYASGDHEQKLHILEALARIGNSSSFSFLVSVFKEPFPILRVAAAAALIQSLNK
jgi:HEAT repeat protein